MCNYNQVWNDNCLASENYAMEELTECFYILHLTLFSLLTYQVN